MIPEAMKNLYLKYFAGREDYFACQGTDFYKPINKKFDSYYLNKHIKGFATFGIYVLTTDSKCNFICIDIDIPKNELENVNFMDADIKYRYLSKKLFSLMDVFENKFQLSKNNILLEDTGGRGYHIWVFFEEPIDGKQAIRLNSIIKKCVDFEFEFFPKQPNLNAKRKLGNLIKLPLGIHQAYDSKSRFFIIDNNNLLLQESLDDNFRLLSSIDKVDCENVERILSENKAISDVYDDKIEIEEIQHTDRIIYKKDFDFLFKHCKALNTLVDKADNGIAFTSAEVFHFANILLSVKESESFITETIKKSYGINYKPQKTIEELDRIKGLYPTSCKTLIRNGICQGYCRDEVRRQNEDDLQKNTNPLILCLNPVEYKKQAVINNIIAQIYDYNNILNAYWKLKKYHSDEDTLFFDEFDFDYFEKDLNSNIKIIQEYFKNEYGVPLNGYIKVKLPKKLGDDDEMEYRQMSYSTIYDQLLIQAVFNIISPLIEADFECISYGYRINDSVNRP